MATIPADTSEEIIRRSGQKPSRDMSRYFAREGVDPLPYAFDGKIAVHPGMFGDGMLAPNKVEEELNRLLAQPRTGKTTVYIHVPFCETHCLYCGFYNGGYKPQESRLYADALIKELHLWENSTMQQSAPIHAVYMGGGTPTALEPEDLCRILKEVRKVLPLANDCEITVEGRLSNFGPAKMEACFEGGANRFSLGVQSFITKIRQSMGRVSTQEQLFAQLERLMSYNQAAVIVDLIYGFPGQSMELWLEDLEIARSVHLDGMDCYQLNVFGPTPLGKAIAAGKMPPAADIPMQSAMFAKSVESMTDHFYRRLSVSHWARTTRERNLYNSSVKGRASCLAFGPGAGGNIGGYFYLNRPDYKAWQGLVNEGKKPIAIMSKPAKDGTMYKAIGEGLEQCWLDIPDLEREFGLPLGEIWKPVLDQWTRVGLVKWRGSLLELTLAGQFWQVNLSQLLQEYLKFSLEENDVRSKNVHA